MKIGLFLPNWLGDLVMATPALRAIRRKFGTNAHIVGIMRPKLTGLLDGTDWLDDEWYFDPRASEPQLRRLALVRRMRQYRFDMAVLFTNSLDTALVAWFGNAKQRIGYARDGRGLFLTKRILPKRAGGKITPAPMVESYLTLSKAIGCNEESPQLELALTPFERRLGDEIWRQLGLRTDGRVIAINNSGAYGSAKRWLPEYAGQLARLIATRLDHDVLIVCGPGEQSTATEIVSFAKHPRVFSLVDQPLGLATTKACLHRVRAVVSTDSGPRHVAAAFGRPVITLLGPTSSVWIENPTVVGEFVSIKLDCTGCAKRVCPLGHHLCMKNLTPEMVFQALQRVINTP